MLKKLLLPVLFIVLLPFVTRAQHIVEGNAMDSTVIHFSGGTIPYYLPDTAGAPLWQTGHTHKSFFTTDTNAIEGIMTDTLNHYPANANNWFIIKVPNGYNTIVDFWHRYQTDSGHAGGMVEFSLDAGITWQNVKGYCNSDSSGEGHGMLTENFYTFNDTLPDGAPAFMGQQSAERYSRFQFFKGLPLKATAGPGCTFSEDTIYVRFRFVSDTTTDTLAGWVIDSIKIENDQYYGAVAKIPSSGSLTILPNPSFTGNFILPALQHEEQYQLEVYNALGIRVAKAPYTHSLQLGTFAKGVYYYKVTDGTEYYSGTLLYE